MYSLLGIKIGWKKSCGPCAGEVGDEIREVDEVVCDQFVEKALGDITSRDFFIRPFKKSATTPSLGGCHVFSSLVEFAHDDSPIR